MADIYTGFPYKVLRLDQGTAHLSLLIYPDMEHARGIQTMALYMEHHLLDETGEVLPSRVWSVSQLGS